MKEKEKENLVSQEDFCASLYQFVTGKKYEGKNIRRDLQHEIAYMKQQRDLFKHVLQSIVARPRLELENTESMAEVGRYSYKAASATLAKFPV